MKCVCSFDDLICFVLWSTLWWRRITTHITWRYLWICWRGQTFFAGNITVSRLHKEHPVLFVNSILFLITYLTDLFLSIQACIWMTVDYIINPRRVQSRYFIRRNLTAITSFKRLYKNYNNDTCKTTQSSCYSLCCWHFNGHSIHKWSK